jgi:RNase P subunit RPR2
MSILAKFHELKKVGEFKCPYCNEVFHTKKQLGGHIGGKHRKNITKTNKILKCKKCNKSLLKGVNWAESAVKQGNLICTPCKRLQNKRSYYNRKKEAQNG